MVDEEQDQDQFAAFIFQDCRNSSSQEELLSHDKIAREDDECSDDYYAPEMVDSGEVRRQLDGGDEFGEMIEGEEFAADDAKLEELENLGFRGEQKGEISGTKLEGFCGEEREIEAELSKCEVSPVVDCCGKMVIEGEVDDGEEIGMFEGDLEVEKVRCLRSGDRGSGDWGENLGGEGVVGDDCDMEGEIAAGRGSKRKLDFELIEVKDEEEDEMKKNKMEFAVDNEVIIVKYDEEESDVGKEWGGGEGSWNAEGDKKRGDDMTTSSPREEKRTKRELPRSLFGLAWGEGSVGRDRVGNQNMEEEEEEEKVLCGQGSGDANQNDEKEEEGVLCGEGNGEANQNVEEKEEEEVACGEGSGDANRNEVIGNDHVVENGVEESSIERNRDGISRGCEEGKTRILLDVLRFLTTGKSINDGGNINFVETVKRRGMTFPRSRFLREEVEDDDDNDEE